MGSLIGTVVCGGPGTGKAVNVRTVANHVSNILFKMNAKNRTEAAAIARRGGLV